MAFLAPTLIIRAYRPLPERGIPMKNTILILLLAVATVGCMETNPPSTPIVPKQTCFIDDWLTELSFEDGWETGCWDWTFCGPDSLCGESKLELEQLPTEKPGWKICWDFQPPLPENFTGDIYLTPRDDARWHKFKWSPADTLPPIPLPRLGLDSEMYPDLLELLKEFTTPFFNMVVTHWPEIPIPIRLQEANNNTIDLAACLAEASEIWNEGSERPWFVIDSEAGWGIRLVHFPDRTMHPPLAAQITRLDPGGRPLRIHILAGNNYQSPLARPYVVRGFVHELGHALFLWGHSMDRIHCLWGLAPPMVSEPSMDERKAARWWHGLPDGFDLSRYGMDLDKLNGPLR